MPLTSAPVATARRPEESLFGHEGPAVVLALALGIVGLTVGILGAVLSSTALAIVAGGIALVLAGLCAWLFVARQKLITKVAETERRLASSSAEAPLAAPAQSDVSSVRPNGTESAPANGAAAVAATAAAGPRTQPADKSDRPSESSPARVEVDGSTSDDADPTPKKGDRETVGLARIGAAVTGPAKDEGNPAVADELIDSRTGLLGESYFVHALNGRVAAARRHLRPLALILMDVIEGTPTKSPSHADPEVVAEIAQSTLRDADTLCRLSDGRFAMILEDTPENGAIWTVERIRRRINERLDDTTAWAGVACYPAHGFDGPEVLGQARRAITAARDWQQDRTEVADT